MEKIDYNKLRIFYLVATEKSLIGVSKKHGYPCSTISNDLMKLESFLKKDLFMKTDRKGSLRPSELTIYGMKLLKICEKIFNQVPNIEKELNSINNEISGNLRIVSSPGLINYMISKNLKELIDKYGDFKIEVVAKVKEINFERDNVDICIDSLKTDIEGLKQHKIIELYFKLFSHVDFDLNNPNLKKTIVFINSDYERNQIEKKQFEGYDFIQLQSTEAILRLVKQKVGICILPSNIGIQEDFPFLKEIDGNVIFTENIYYTYSRKYEGYEKYEILLNTIKNSLS